eukprot:5245337-Pyramimonas_sp.AAC.1
MVSAFGRPAGSPGFDWMELPTAKGPKTPHPFLLPHKFFSTFFNELPARFRDTVSGPRGACGQFWESIRFSDFVRRHPNLPRHLWGQIVPLGMHADAGAFNAHDSLYVISWNSLVGAGGTVAKRFIFTVLRKSEMRADTLDAALKIFSWSMNALLTGVAPPEDPQGRPHRDAGQELAKGWRAALCQ